VSQPSAIQPYVGAILLCDAIITEETTRKKTLVGIFDRVLSPVFPSAHRFSVYVKLTDAQGSYRVRLDFVDISGDQVIERLEFGPIDVLDRLVPAELAIAIGATVPAPGAYEFRLFTNDAYLGRAPFEAVRVDPQGGPQHGHHA
jgi:hypothetical protein